MVLRGVWRVQVLVSRHWQRHGACAPAPTRTLSDWTTWTTTTGASTLRAGWPLLTRGPRNVAWCGCGFRAMMAWLWGQDAVERCRGIEG
jgi:hypothetical protein